tara:strand:+ start:1228 stop:1374 length:147 start_codon:yes stop_codon:yes gene_type:complete
MSTFATFATFASTLTPDGVVALGLLAVLLVVAPLALTSPGMRRAWRGR